jgi:serine/threonine protein kinase
MPNPQPHAEDDFDGVDPESVEILLSDHLKYVDDLSIQSAVSTDSLKPKSKITDYNFDSGVINPSEVVFPSSGGGSGGTPIPASDAPSDGAPFSPGFAERQSDRPDTDLDGENSEEASQDEIPTIDGYVILRELGRGGMGVVYKAKQMKLERIVALKMILHHGYLTKENLNRFRTEADALARVAHPGIVQVYEIGEHDGQAYFTLEYCGGGSLAREIKKGPFAPKRAAEVVEQLARAVHFAHEAKIIHRDLKPGNILRTTLGQYKITDFGLAKKLDVDEKLTQSGAIIGTPGYMAPEQASGDVNKLGPPCDIYALGVILYECITGRVPFRAQNVMDAVIQVVTLEPVAPSRLEPKTPKDLETIILKCLHKTPERRYKTAADLAEDLGRFLRGEPILGRPASFWERTGKWVRKHPATAASLAFSLFAVVGFLIMTMLQKDELEVQVADARAKERSIQAELKLVNTQIREKDDINAALEEARVAERNRDWTLMKAASARAFSIARDKDAFKKLADDATEIQKLADQQIALAEAKALQEQKLVANLKFLSDLDTLRDEARTLSSPFTNLELDVRQQGIIDSCFAGLKKLGLDAEVEPNLPYPEGMTVEQQTRVRESAFEFYLLLADAVAMTEIGLPEQAVRTRAEQGLKYLAHGEKLIAQDPSLARRKAGLLRQADRAAEAEKVELEGEKRTPKTAFDYFLLGESYYLLGQAKQAKEAFDLSLQQDSGYFWSQFYLGLTALQATPRSPAEAKSYMNFCISRKPNYVPLYIVRGVANLQLNDPKAAEEDFSKAFELPISDLTRFGVLVNRASARSHRIIGDSDGAIADLEAARKIRPEEPSLFPMLAKIYWDRGDKAKAFAELDHAIKTVKKPDAQLFRTRSLYRKQNGDRSGAIADLTEAIKLTPASSTLAFRFRLDQAQLLLLDKKFDEALKMCDETLALPSWTRHRNFRIEAYRMKAEAIVQANPADKTRYDLALRAWEAAEKEGWEPKLEDYRFRGTTYTKMGKYSEAIADLSVAIDLSRKLTNETANATTANLLTDRGWLYLRINALKVAHEDFTEAVKIEPTAEGRSGHAFTEALFGDVAAAVKEFEEAEKAAGESKRVIFNGVRVYATAANRLAQPQPNGKPLATSLVQKRNEYLEKALGLLTRTMLQVKPAEQKQFWKEISQDPTIRSLSKLPGYLKLDAIYGSKNNTETQP